MKKGFEEWDYLTIEDYTEIVTDYVANGSFASLKENVKIGKEEDYALMVKTADFANGFSKGLTYTDIHGYEYLAKSKLYGGELLLSNIGSVGKVFRVPYFNRPMTLASNSIMLRCKNELDYQWAYYFFLSPIGRQKLEQICTGTTMKKFNKTGLRAVELPICSDDKRKDIICKIEEMLSALDNAVETLNKTKEQLAVYRQAVLREAFSNIKHYEIIRNVSRFVTSGSRGWAKYYADKGALFIRIGNLTRTAIDINLEDRQYVNLPQKAEGKRTRLQPGDVLVSITADLGSIGFVTNKIQEAYVNQHIAMIRFKNPEQGEMYAWFLRSQLGQKDLLKNKRGAGKLGLGLDDIRDSRVPNISDEEAKRIVDSIEERFSVCDSIQLTVDEALQQAEAMRQSILKEAFEGRL